MGTCYIALPETPNLEKMVGLRTLEISVELDWAEIQENGGQGNPLNDVMLTLDTAPHNVQHFVLNLNIWDPDALSNFTEFMSFGRLGHLGEDRPALRDVVVRIVVRIVSGYDHSALQRGIRYLEAVFYRLHERGMLTAIAVRPPSREDN
jgi:hypothetical protein